jgi:Zn-dependent alcohol dehydrogenase
LAVLGVGAVGFAAVMAAKASGAGVIVALTVLNVWHSRSKARGDADDQFTQRRRCK